MQTVKLVNSKEEIEVEGFTAKNGVAQYRYNDQYWTIPLSRLEYAKYKDDSQSAAVEYAAPHF